MDLLLHAAAQRPFGQVERAGTSIMRSKYLLYREGWANDLLKRQSAEKEQAMRSTKKKPEKADDGFRFEVGAMYENMKGAYEVISIQNDSMLIRWGDGSEVVTPVDLQRRIIDRMAYEKRLRQQEKVVGKGKAPKKPKKKI